MTLSEAYALLETRWPGRSFCIGMECWRHIREYRKGHKAPQIEWSVYDIESHEDYRGPTLQNAMDQALGGATDLAATDREIERFTDGSGYLIHGPLRQETA